VELNTVRVRNCCVQKLLANNDINATAVAFEVNSSGNDVEVSASSEFWEFLSTGGCLKIMHPGVAKDPFYRPHLLRSTKVSTYPLRLKEGRIHCIG
jgi:hypothetical protein